MQLSKNISTDKGFCIKKSTFISGATINYLGDINGDGIDDFIVATPYGTNEYRGEVYIILGQTSNRINVDLDNFNSSQGYKIIGANVSDTIGIFSSGVGDINHDGHTDLLIGAPYIGKAYVILGKENINPNIDLNNLSIDEGFTITGSKLVNQSGYKISSCRLGDVNSDGIEDYAISISYSNLVYVLYGQESNTNINLDSLTSTQGNIISGDGKFGTSISNVGDINGDGIDDFIIGAPYNNSYRGTSFVIYGKLGGIGNIEVNNLTITQGFSITGGVNNIVSSYSITGNIDINKDGILDIALSSPNANTHTIAQIIFGKKQDTRPNINLDNLQPNEGLSATSPNYYSFSQIMVSSVGDIDGDGFKDLGIGIFRATAHGVVGAGAVYLINDIYGSLSYAPSAQPTTEHPTISIAPTLKPSFSPSVKPTAIPTNVPSFKPTPIPSLSPTKSPDSTSIDLLHNLNYLTPNYRYQL